MLPTVVPGSVGLCRSRVPQRRRAAVLLAGVLVAGIAGAVCFGFPGPAQAQGTDPLLWIPANVNAAAVIKVQALKDSPIGVREGWAQLHESGYATGDLGAPPWVTEVYRAARIGGGASESYGLLRLPRETPVRIEDVARHENGVVENMGGFFYVHSNRGCYFIRLGSDLIGMLFPDNRQLMSQWLRFGRVNREPALPDYLHAALAGDADAQFIIAIDMQDMLHPAMLSAYLEHSASLRDRTKERAALEKLFTSLRGARVLVRAKADLTAQLKLDFAETPPVGEAELLKQPIIDFLSDMGAHVENLQQASISVQDNSVVMTTPLTSEGLQRILTVVRSPSPGLRATAAAPANPNEPNAVASQRYFRSVQGLLNNLYRKAQRGTDYNKTALWHSNFAQEIQGLSTGGVDPALVQWGSHMANGLFALSESLKGVPVSVQSLESQIHVDTRTFWWRTGLTPFGGQYMPFGGTTQSNLHEVRQAQAEAVAQGAQERDKIWTSMQQETQSVLNQMSQKYGADFGAAQR